MLTRLRAAWANPWLRWPVNVASVILMIPLLYWLSVRLLSSDAPLHDEIDAVLRLERPAEDPGNAYYALLGISAPESADAHRVGTLAVMIAFDKIDNGEPVERVVPTVPGGDALAIAPIPLVCPAGQRVCLGPMRAQVAVARQWERAHGAVWDRYLEAATLPRYADVELGAETLAARLAILSDAARFMAVERWSRGQQARAIEIMDRGITLCRRVLAGTVALPVKRAAARCVADGWQLAAALALDSPPAALRRTAPLLHGFAQPLSAEEIAIGAMVRSELRSRMPTVLELPQARALTEPDNPWLEALLRPFFQRSATLNRYFEDGMAQIALERMPSSELVVRTPPPVDAHWWTRLRSGNPIGLALLDHVPRDTLVPLLLELRALESQRRLLLLVMQCAASGVLPKDPAACAASAPPELRNPFDGSAPAWDAAARTLAMSVPSAMYREQLPVPAVQLSAR